MNKCKVLCWIALAVILLRTPALTQELEDNNVARTLRWYGTDLDGIPCRGGLSGYGPYDYTNPAHRSCCLNIVEGAHFTPEVETLQKGVTNTLPTGDIDYTLRAWPNHPRALLAMIRFQLLNKRDPESSLTPAECYLQRAEVFNPNDPNISFLYGFYLHRKGLYDKALAQYQKAESMSADFPALHYYMAKLYLALGNKEEAAQHAERASSLGVSSNAFSEKLR